MKRCLAEFASAMNGQLIGPDTSFSAVSTDSRTCEAGSLFFALKGERFDGHDFVAAASQRGVAAIVVDHRCDVGVPQIIVQDTLVALQAAAAGWRKNFQIPVIGVAGSNGKTTTKEMIARIFEQRGACLATQGTLNNHIGVPLTLLSIDARHAFAVIEIGANHPGEVAALTKLVEPSIAVVTNAGAEHLEGFGSLAGAARAEGELFEGLGSSAAAIINADDEFADLWRALNRADTVVSFGQLSQADCCVSGEIDVSGIAGERQRFTLVTPTGTAAVELPLAGAHNVLNALAASAVAHAAGISAVEIASGLADMRAVKGRLVVKSASAGGCVIDDSYNANPSSFEAGIKVLATASGERWVVLGNMAELGSVEVAAHREAGLFARNAGVSRLFTLGDSAALAADAFGDGAEKFFDANELAQHIKPMIAPGITVLVKGSRVNRLERVVDAIAAQPNERS